MFWFWFFVGPALLLAVWSLRGERKRARFVAEQLAIDPNPNPPPATVIVSIQGPEQDLRESLAALASLDYPDYELIVAARRAADIPPAVLPSRVVVVLGGANDAGRNDHIQNLVAAVRAARKRSQVFAFAACDGVVTKNWLRALAAPLGASDVGASTGSRWYVPRPPDFWSLMRSVWHAPIAGLLGPRDNQFVCGGAMAMRKETFFEIRVSDVWRRAVSDAGGLARAVHNARRTIAFAPGAMVACTTRISAHEFFRVARQQMALARIYLPRLWWGAFVAHIFYCGAMVAAITASVLGSRGAEWALVAQFGLGMLKGVNRATLARAARPDREAWFKRHAWVHALWVPLATWIWLWVLISSVFTKPSNFTRQAV